MANRIPIKNHMHEIHLVNRRIWGTLAIIGLLTSLLMLRLWYLQVHKQEVYTTLSTKNWLDLVPVEPTRGLIYDRHGQLLAENVPVFSLDIVPMQVADLTATLNNLQKLIELSENDIRQFKKQLKQYRRFDEIPLKIKLSEREVAKFTENQHRFPGVTVKARLMRYYPFGESLSHVLGYVGRINTEELQEIDQTNYSASHYIGKLGIEKFYEKDLHGAVGYEEVENDASGKSLRVLNEIPGKPGKNIYLTLDAGLQLTAEKALNGHRGAIVIIKPTTGEVLAMVSTPSYDPNLFVSGISQNQFLTLQKSQDRPLFNRALRGTYPMASTIKPFLALKGLDDELIDEDTTIYDSGVYRLPNNTHPYHDWVPWGHGKVNVTKAIMSSCDIFFYELGYRLGITRMGNFLKSFGFGASTGIDLNEELSGIVPSVEWKRKAKGAAWYDGDTIISSIGQGYMVATPLQLASATATLANRGNGFTPHLLLQEQSPRQDAIVYQPNALKPIELKDQENWDIVLEAMHKVVASPQGTAFSFGRNHPYTYQLAGKTGTAQVTSKRRIPDELDKQEELPEKLRDHHLFISFAPVKNPEIAVAIITENSNSTIDAAQIIYDYYFTHRLGIIDHASVSAPLPKA